MREFYFILTVGLALLCGCQKEDVRQHDKDSMMLVGVSTLKKAGVLLDEQQNTTVERVYLEKGHDTYVTEWMSNAAHKNSPFPGKFKLADLKLEPGYGMSSTFLKDIPLLQEDGKTLLLSDKKEMRVTYSEMSGVGAGGKSHLEISIIYEDFTFTWVSNDSK